MFTREAEEVYIRKVTNDADMMLTSAFKSNKDATPVRVMLRKLID